MFLPMRHRSLASEETDVPDATSTAQFDFNEPRNRRERRASQADPVAWRVNDWRRQVPMSRSTFYAQVRLGRIELVKVGRATLVTTPPKDYIASLRTTTA
jgi:hypothetical protein